MTRLTTKIGQQFYPTLSGNLGVKIVNIFFPICGKGGVAKTFTSFCFSYYLSSIKADFEVLDFDFKQSKLFDAYSNYDKAYRIESDFEDALHNTHTLLINLTVKNLVVNCPGDFLQRFQTHICAAVVDALAVKKGTLLLIYIVPSIDYLIDFFDWYNLFFNNVNLKVILIYQEHLWGRAVASDLEDTLGEKGIKFTSTRLPRINSGLVPKFYDQKLPLELIEDSTNSLLKTSFLIYRANLSKLGEVLEGLEL